MPYRLLDLCTDELTLCIIETQPSLHFVVIVDVPGLLQRFLKPSLLRLQLSTVCELCVC